MVETIDHDLVEPLTCTPHVQVADGDSTTLLVAGDDGELRAGLEVSGLPYGLLRVR